VDLLELIIGLVPLDPQIIIGPGVKIGRGIAIGANSQPQNTDFIQEINTTQFVSESGANFITEN